MKKTLIIMATLVGGLISTVNYASADSYHNRSFGYVPYHTGGYLFDRNQDHRGPYLNDWPNLTTVDQIKAYENKVERVFGRGRLRVPYSISRDVSTGVWTNRYG